MNFGSFWAHLWRSVQIDTQSSFCSAVRRQGTKFADTRLSCKSSVRILWHVPNAIPTSSATSLIVRHWSVQMISRTHATVSSVWGWMACLGGGCLQRIGIHFWNRNTTQMSSIDLGRTLQKLLAAFCTFQHQFSPDGNRNWCTHAAELSPPSWDATHTADRHSLRGFHRANAGRYRLPVMQVHLHRVATCHAFSPLRCVL